MGWTSAIAAALLLHGTSPRLPVDEDPPPPRPAPKPAPGKVIDFTCILDEPLPPPLPPQLVTCHVRPPDIPGVSFLHRCPEWIGKIVAEADRL